MCQVIEKMVTKSAADLHVLELGCGTGLCGAVAAKMGCKSTLTDRSADLAKLNVDLISSVPGVPLNIAVYDMPWESSLATAGDRPTSMDAEGEEPVISVSSVLNLRGKVDVIVGAEITCLRKQQGLMVDTIVQLTANNPDAVVLLSFDSAPPPNGCLYEQDMLQRMEAVGFMHSVVYVAGCVWKTDLFTPDTASRKNAESTENSLPVHKVSRAYLVDRTNEYQSAKQRLHFPVGARNVSTSSEAKPAGLDCKDSVNVPSIIGLAQDKSTFTGASSLPSLASLNFDCHAEAKSSGVSRTTTSEEGVHHITAFYRPAAAHTCRRCQQQYFAHPALNPFHACRHHSGYFVCRYHPAETKCSINGHGDGLGYYGNGQEGYEAKFWDCCGSEDPAARGCCCRPHEAY